MARVLRSSSGSEKMNSGFWRRGWTFSVSAMSRESQMRQTRTCLPRWGRVNKNSSLGRLSRNGNRRSHPGMEDASPIMKCKFRLCVIVYTVTGVQTAVQRKISWFPTES
jgi:hypothetical protein